MIKTRILPDFCHPGRELRNPELIVVHGISCIYARPSNPYSLEECYNLFVDMSRDPRDRVHGFDGMPDFAVPISAHALIGRKGEIIELIPDSMVANHAGRSTWNGRKWCNNFSLGVELIGSWKDEYTDAQYASLNYWLARKMVEHHIPLKNIVGHRDVSPGRKKDPWDTFEWNRVRSQLDNIILE